MAWRIHESVVRGEIDNREKGVVRGKIWLQDEAEPVVLELAGNAHLDLAGCLLKFTHTGAPVALPKDGRMARCQRGVVGDLTASRKVRVPAVPLEEFMALRRAGQPAPEHLANCMYLEWYSEANGRVVLESTDHQLEISEPAWRPTPEDEAQRQRDAAQGFFGFMRQLGQALSSAGSQPVEEKEWDEFDYERFLKESDARTNKYSELLDKFGDHPDGDAIIAREMGWDDADDDGDEAAEGDEDRLAVEEINRITEEAMNNPPEPDAATEGVDWIRTEDGDIKHPLSHRAMESVIALMHRVRELNLEQSDDADLARLVGEFQITGAKLAGALDSLAFGRESRERAFIVAYLKRALNHLHAAQAGLEAVATKKILPDEDSHRARREIFELREEILRLMDEFRGRK